MHVRENREHLRSAVFVPVKRMDQLSTGFQAITASVSKFCFYLHYEVVELQLICVLQMRWISERVPNQCKRSTGLLS